MGATGDVPKRMIELLKGMKSYVSQTLGETEGQTPLTLKDFPSVSDLEDEDWFTVDDLLAAFADIKTRPHLMDIFKSKHGWKAHFKINGAIYKYFQALENGRLPVAPPSSAPQKTEEAADPPTPQHEPFSAVELAVPTVATIRAAVSPLPTLPRAEASDSSAEGCFSYAEQLPQQQQQQQQCESRPFVNPLFDDGGAPSGSDGSGTAGVVAASCWEEATPSAPPPAVVCTRRYAGISNQGATCYLNSLLQSMVHIPYFRAEMYKMQVDDGGSGTAADADNGDAAADQDMRGPSVDDAASGSASGSGSDLPDGKRRRLDGGSDEDCGGGGDDDDESASSSSESECGTEGDGSEARQGGRGIPRALQRLFYDMESIRVSEEERAASGEPSEEDRRWPAYPGYQSSRSVSTLGLTTSFGWDQYEVSRQQDIQELLRVLTDSLSERLTKLDPNPHRNFIKKLFMGELVRYSRCLDIKYDSRRSEDFFDVSLDVAGMGCLRESLDAYVKEEVMDGDNKYEVEFPDGRKELHPAARGCRFRKLPPVLMLHLKRFEYDPYTDSQRKVNNRFAFDDEIDLSPYVEGPTTADAAAASPGTCPRSPTEGPLITREQTNESFCSAAASPAASGGCAGKHLYDLHSVMVHIGSINGGHYICYVRPEGPGTPWIKFNDDHVTAATPQEATTDNFGGAGGWGAATTAYLLTYVRRNAVAKLFTPPTAGDLSVVRRRFEAETKREEAARAAKEHALHNMTVVAVQADTLRDPRCLRSSIQGLRGAAEVETRRAKRRRAKEGAAAAVAAGGAMGGVSIAMKKANTLEQLRLGVITELNKQKKAAGVAPLDFFLNAPNSVGRRGRARRTARLWRLNDEGRVEGGCLTPLVTLRADTFPADQSTCMGEDEYATLKARSSTKLETAFGINTYATDMITAAVLVEEVEVGGEPLDSDAAAVATPTPHHVSLLSDSGIMSGVGCLVLIKYYDPYATADADKMRCVGLMSCELGQTTLGDVLRLVAARAARAGGAGEGAGGGGYAVFVEESAKKVVGALVEGGYREDMTLAAMLESMSDLLPKPRRTTHYHSASYWSYDEPEPAPTPARHELMLIVQACASEAHVAYLMHAEAAERGLLPRAGSSGSDGPPVGGLPCGGSGGGGGAASGAVAGAPPSPPVTPSDLHLAPQAQAQAAGGGGAVAVGLGGGEAPPPSSHANRFVFSCRDFFLDALHRMVVRLEPYPYAARTAGVWSDTLRAALEACGARVAAALTEEGLGGAYHQQHHHHRSAAAYAAAASPPVFDTTLRSYETVGVAAEKVARHIRAKYLAVFDRAVREGVAARRGTAGGGGGALPARARVQKLLRARIRAEALRFTVHRRAADKPDGTHIPSREYSRFPPDYLKQEDAYPMHAAAAAAAETTASKRRARRRGCKPASVYHRLYYEVLPLSLSDIEDLRQDEGYVTVLDPPVRAAVRCRSEEEAAAAAAEEEEEEEEGVDDASSSPAPPPSPSPIFARGSRFEAALGGGEGGQVGVSVAAGQHYFYSVPAVLQWEVDGHPNGAAQAERNRHGYLDPGARATVDTLSEALLMRHDMLSCGKPSDVEDGADAEGLEELVEDYVTTPLAHMEDRLFVGARGSSAGQASTHVLLVYKAKGGTIMAAYAPASKESVPGKYLSRDGAVRYSYGYASASSTRPQYRWVLVRVGASGSGRLTMLSEAISQGERRRYSGFSEDPETAAEAEAESDDAEVCVPVARVAVDRATNDNGSGSSGNGQDCNLAFFGQPFAVLARRGDTVGALRRRVAEYLLGGAGGGDGGCLAGLGSGDLPLYVSDGIDHAALDEDDEPFLASLAKRNNHYRELFVCCELPVAAQAAAQEATKAKKTVMATSSWARRANQGIKFN